MPQSSGSGLRQIAKEAAQTAKTKVETLKSEAQEQGGAAVEEIKTVAQSATRQAQEASREFVQDQKENLAQKVDQYTEAMRAACESCVARKAMCSWVQLKRRPTNLNECPATCAKNSPLTF